MELSEDEERDLVEQQIIATLQDIDAELTKCRETACDLLAEAKRLVRTVKEGKVSMQVWLKFFDIFNDNAHSQKSLMEALERTTMEVGEERSELAASYDRVVGEQEAIQAQSCLESTPQRPGGSWVAHVQADDSLVSFSPLKCVEPTLLFSPTNGCSFLCSSNVEGQLTSTRPMAADNDTEMSEDMSPSKMNFTMVAPQLPEQIAFRPEESGNTSASTSLLSDYQMSTFLQQPKQPRPGEQLQTTSDAANSTTLSMYDAGAGVASTTSSNRPEEAGLGSADQPSDMDASSFMEASVAYTPGNGLDISQFPSVFQHGPGAEQLQLVYARLEEANGKALSLNEIRSGLSLPPGRLEMILDLMTARRLVLSHRMNGTVAFVLNL